MQHVQRAASIVKQHLLQSAFDEGKLAEAFDIIKTCPEEFCSGKWTEERFLTALHSAGDDNARELKRDLNVKPNEALSKEKARAIISSGDDGVVRHLFDAGLLEKVLFENPVFEKRSIKHASMQELGRRAGEMMRCYDFIASMDFGAFDGSCTSEVRSIVENDIIVSMFSKLLDPENDSGLLYTMRFAIASRTRRKASVGDAHMHGSEKTIVISYYIDARCISIIYIMHGRLTFHTYIYDMYMLRVLYPARPLANIEKPEFKLETLNFKKNKT